MPEITTREWIDKVLLEHRQLDAMVADLRRFLAAERPAPGESGAHTWSAELTRRLVLLHDRLFRHFREEEEGGMVEEISRRHPRAARAVEELVDEHRQMLGRLRRITARAMQYGEGEAPSKPELRSQLTELLDLLNHHERTETGLIHQLEIQELGQGD